MGSSVTDKDDVIFREVRRDSLYYRFYPFHISIHRIACEDIKAVKARTYRPIMEYGGWGIRWSRRGKAYNVYGNRGGPA